MTGERSLAALLAELAAGWPDVTATVATDGRIEWARGGVAFAALAGGVAELRLDAAVAAAALRTPDTTPSPRGSPWVRFAPRQLDGHAIDRASAWFGFAHRRATTT